MSEEKPKFDPAKRYTWGQQDKFELTGEQFGLILNSLRSFISTPEAQRVLLGVQAAEALDSVLAKSVESGVVKEAPEENPQQ